MVPAKVPRPVAGPATAIMVGLATVYFLRFFLGARQDRSPAQSCAAAPRSPVTRHHRCAPAWCRASPKLFRRKWTLAAALERAKAGSKDHQRWGWTGEVSTVRGVGAATFLGCWKVGTVAGFTKGTTTRDGSTTAMSGSCCRCGGGDSCGSDCDRDVGDSAFVGAGRGEPDAGELERGDGGR